MKLILLPIKFILFFSVIFSICLEGSEGKKVMIAILARNKAHVLPTYLKCIENLDYDKKLLSIYINTNDNEDDTAELLAAWVSKNKELYQAVEMEHYQVPGHPQARPHEWTSARFKILGSIRNKSLTKTAELGCDYYFVVDCDNFIAPCTLKELISKDKPVIAPLLKAIPEVGDCYSNYFCAVNEHGYYANDPDYLKILHRVVRGTFKVPVVHCTYLIKSDCLENLGYVDDTLDYEFVIFSKKARVNGVGQYICNEKTFGTLLHFYQDLTLEEEKVRFSALREADICNFNPL